MIDKLNDLVGKPYDKINYHCYHFIEEVLDVPKLLDVHTNTAKDDVSHYKDLFEEIDEPEDYCIALLGISHIGIYYKGGIFHNDVQGVKYDRTRNIKLRYKSIVYYLKK